MGLFSKLFGQDKNDAIPTQASPAERAPPLVSSTMRETLKTPELLAPWLYKYIINCYPIDDDYEIAPDAEIKESLGITDEQIDRLAREQSVLRLAGALYFVRESFPHSSFLKTLHLCSPLLAGYMYSTEAPLEAQKDEALDALARYIVNWEEEEDQEHPIIQYGYIQRVFHDHPQKNNFCDAGFGKVAPNTIKRTELLFGEVYCQTINHDSYENTKKTIKIINEVLSQETDT